MMGAMEISFDIGAVSSETTVGTIGVGQGSIGSAMMGHCSHWVDWSDQMDCFNLRAHFGLARSFISMSDVSSNTDLRSSGLDMLIDDSAMKAVDDDHRL